MKKYFVKSPKVLNHLFNQWKWRFSQQELAIYLTFDDGPTPDITEWTLNQLKKYKAEATFFCLGKNVAKYPEIFSKIVNQGHAIGNHTYNHINGLKHATDKYIADVISSEKTIFKIGNIKSTLFRPPYGKFRISQSKKIRKIGYKIVMWDVLSADFDASISNIDCLLNVVKNTENGSIIVFHDSKKASEKLKYALPKVLEYYAQKGYSFKKIS